MSKHIVDPNALQIVITSSSVTGQVGMTTNRPCNSRTLTILFCQCLLQMIKAENAGTAGAVAQNVQGPGDVA